MAKPFLAAFHIVYVTSVFLFVCTCIAEKKFFFFFFFYRMKNSFFE